MRKNIGPNCGVYQIRNLLDNKIYVGQSIHLNKRENEHFGALRRGNHTNRHLQNAYNLYGKECFVYEILLYCEEFELTRYEDAIKKSHEDNCYNIRVVCDSNKGLKHTDEYKRNASESKKGDKNPNFGKSPSAETRKKQSDVLKGRPSPMLGRTQSEDTRKKMSNSRLGEKNPMFGKPRSDETKKKISEANTGNKWSDEARQRITKNKPETSTDEPKKSMSEQMSGENNPMSRKNIEKRRLAKLNLDLNG